MLDFFHFLPSLRAAVPSSAKRRTKALVETKRRGEKCQAVVSLWEDLTSSLTLPTPTSSLRLYPRSREKRGTLEDCIKNLAFLKHARLIT